jgi:MFS family permease
MRPGADRSRESDAVYGRIFWRIMPFLVLVYVIAFIDRSNVGVAKLQFTGDLGFSEAVYGFGSGIFYLGYLLLEIPSNLYLARVGLRRTLVRIMILWGLCCAALGLMSDAWQFYGLRFLLGAAEAGLFPGMLLYLTYWVPAARRAQFMAMLLASIPVAGVLGGPLAGWIMSGLAGVLDLAGWRWLFVIEGLPAVALGVVAYHYLDDGPAACRWLTGAQKATVARDLAQDRLWSRTRTHDSFLAVLKDSRFYMMGGLAFAILVSTASLFLWAPTIVRGAGVEDVLQVGLLSSLPFGVGLVAQVVVARHSDRTMERRWHAAGPALVAACGWLAMPLVADSPRLALAALCVAAAGSLAATAPFWTLLTTLLSGRAAAGGIALITTIAGVGNFLSPVLVGFLSDRTGSMAVGQFYFAGLLAVGALMLLLGVRATRAAPTPIAGACPI